MKIYKCFILVFLCLLFENYIFADCDESLSAWIECNNGIVISYLQSLKPEQEGKTIKGVVLTDGTKIIQNNTFVKKIKYKDVNIAIFKSLKNRHTNFFWTDLKRGENKTKTNFSSFLIPECGVKETKFQFPKNLVLSGDSYVYKHLIYNELVYNTCSLADWLEWLYGKTK